MRRLIPRPWFTWPLLLLGLTGLPATAGPDNAGLGPSAAPGQSVTLLPDGRWLVIGGHVGSSPTGTVRTVDIQNGASGALPSLHESRAWHTATVLPDGRVLVFGGMDRSGVVLASPEIVDVVAQTVTPVSRPELPPRAYHTATLMTDGRVLLAGGTGPAGEPLEAADLWRSTDGGATVAMSIARSGHQARLEADGTVLLWGGYTAGGVATSAGDRFDPEQGSFTVVPAPGDGMLPGGAPVVLEESLPADGADEVRVDQRTALRFSTRLRVDALTPGTVSLSGPLGPEPVHVVAAEGGMLVFVTPMLGLAAGTGYTLSVNGAETTDGVLVPLIQIRFVTAGERRDLPGSSGGSSADSAPPLSTSPVGGDLESSEPGTAASNATHPSKSEEPSAHGGLPSRSNDPVFRLTSTTLWPWGCINWPGWVACGTFSSEPPVPPNKFCPTGYFKLDEDRGTCGHHFPGAGQTPGPTSQAGREVLAADPVDLATGIFMLTKTDLALPGPLPLAFGRVYRSGDPFPGAFGVGTTLDYDAFVRRDSATVITYTYRANAQTVFTRQPDGTFTTTAVAAFLGTRITANVDGTYTLRQKDGATTTFNSQGKQVGRADRFGNAVTITRTATSTTAAITGPPGRARSLKWQGWPISQVTDSAGRTVLYGYDANYRLVSVTDPAGGVTQYGYDTADRLTTITDPRGIMFLENAYDVNSRVCQQEQADGVVFKFYYVTADVATTPASLQLLSEAEAGGAISQAPCTAAASSQPVVATVLVNPRGYPTTYRFNAAGVVTQVTNALGQITSHTRDATSHALLTTTDTLGRHTTATYDANGNVLTLTRLAGTANAVTTTATYEPTFNQLAIATNPLGHATSFSYTGMGALQSVTNALSQSTTLSSNAAGQVITITDPLGNTAQFGYDVDDLSTTTDPSTAVTARFSDAAGRLLSLTSPRGQRTRYDYNPLNLLTGVTDPRGGLTQFTYDGNGNLLTLTDARGQATAYSYDVMDRVASRTDPLTRQETFTYDSNSNPVSHTDRKGQVTSRSYDALDRLIQVTFADASTIAYTYDAGGRVTQIVDSLNGTIARSYDGLDRLTQEVAPQGTVNYTYDATGRRTSMTVTGQPTVSYTYDNADRLTHIQQGTSVVTMTYDAAGRRTALTLPNGVTTTTTYDAAARVTALTYAHGGMTLGTLTYAYDADGNRTSVGGTWGRTGIPQAVSSATYNAGNQQVSFGGQTLTFDLNGNITSDGMNIYTWNARDQLVAISGGSVAATFAYDAVNRRTRKTISGTQTDVLHDGADAVQETTGAAITTMLSGLGIDTPLLRVDANGTVGLLTDALGSVVSLATATGSVATSYTYEPFGDTTTTGVPSSNSTQYTARENDGTGLYYYRARYYHPKLHRFMREDPIGHSQAGNPYAYVENNPLRWRDPRGLYVEVVFWQPTSSWGSQFGHVSVNINGQNFSFGPRQWDTTYPNAADYAARQQQFRGGTGVVLDMSPGQESQFAQCMLNWKDPYSSARNNCATPIQSCLNTIGAGTGRIRIFPGDFYSDLVSSSAFSGLTSYPTPNPLPSSPTAP